MNKMAEFKTKLEDQLNELTQRAKDIDDDLKEPHDDDWSENAVESENDEVLEKLGGMALIEIRQIKLALSKIEAGTYGTCEICHDQIALGRLEALPYATRCIACVTDR